MSGWIKAACAAALLFFAGGAAAQTEYERAGAQRDWAVFAVGQGQDRVCWIVSKPKSSTARRGGSTVQVNRGDIYLMVSTWPGRNVAEEVSLMVGYPVKPGAPIRLEVGSDTFELFADDDTGWLESAAVDARAVAAMRAGVEAKATGLSARGTTTIDTFSLLGFTAAMADAKQLCS